MLLLSYNSCECFYSYLVFIDRLYQMDTQTYLAIILEQNQTFFSVVNFLKRRRRGKTKGGYIFSMSILFLSVSCKTCSILFSLYRRFIESLDCLIHFSLKDWTFFSWSSSRVQCLTFFPLLLE